MYKYIANKNIKVSSIYGSINLIEGNDYPIHLYKKFPQYFTVDIIEDTVPQEEIVEEIIIKEPKQNSFKKDKGIK